MSQPILSLDATRERLAAHRAQVADLRTRCQERFLRGATGVQVAAALAEGVDRIVCERFQEAFEELPPEARKQVQQECAVIAVGGSGRGEVAPYSDCDLLFLHQPEAEGPFAECSARAIRDLWDAGIKVGAGTRTLPETLALARQEADVATAVVEARLLWGSSELFHTLRRRVRRQFGGRHLRGFVEACMAARQRELGEHGLTVQQLQPDIKRAQGGLRDLHLIRWIGFAHYGKPDIETLRLKGAISRDDSRTLLAATEFLTHLRIDLHYHARKAQDVLDRDEQLRIAEEREIPGTVGLRPVECFMRNYFQHSAAIAEISQRFVSVHRPRSLITRVAAGMVTHRADRLYRVGPETIDIIARKRKSICSTLEGLLRTYYAATLNDVMPAPPLVAAIKRAEPTISGEISAESASLFMKILDTGGNLGRILRSMFETGLLELVIPNMAHARCLLQFNQYHSYTVDEHTLRAVEAVVAYEQDDGPLGTAYREIHHKDILHLALLLHDLGKGFEEDHSELGRAIADRIADRLQLPEHHRETLVLLVHKHLKMSHLAFRRDITDPNVLYEFAREVGSPQTLRMLYVLTAADITAVGPGVWTDWKGELLTELYNRTMLILSGRPYLYHEVERMQRIREEVCARMGTTFEQSGPAPLQEWIQQQLDDFPPHYLSTTTPERIAADLELIRSLGDEDVIIECDYEEETDTLDLRIVMRQSTCSGLFSRAAGALTAQGLEILSAQICTTNDGIAIDAFRVRDDDSIGEVLPDRIDTITSSLRAAVTGSVPIEQLFHRHRRFRAREEEEPISEQPLRAVVDNDSSDRCTIIDIFANDRPGLLFTVSQRIFKLGLSVDLAKISTHLDQVVDVFYVTDTDGEKIRDGHRLRHIAAEMTDTVENFERDGWQEFVRQGL